MLLLTKILENSPTSGPDPIVCCVYLFGKIHIAQSYTLNLIVFIVFRQFLLPQTKSRSVFVPQTEKSFPRLCGIP